MWSFPQKTSYLSSTYLILNFLLILKKTVCLFILIEFRRRDRVNTQTHTNYTNSAKLPVDFGTICIDTSCIYFSSNPTRTRAWEMSKLDEKPQALSSKDYIDANKAPGKNWDKLRPIQEICSSILMRIRHNSESILRYKIYLNGWHKMGYISFLLWLLTDWMHSRIWQQNCHFRPPVLRLLSIAIISKGRKSFCYYYCYPLIKVKPLIFNVCCSG